MKLFLDKLHASVKQYSLTDDSLDVKLTKIMMSGLNYSPEEWMEFISTKEGKEMTFFFYMFFNLDSDELHHFHPLVKLEGGDDGVVYLTSELMFEIIGEINTYREKIQRSTIGPFTLLSKGHADARGTTGKHSVSDDTHISGGIPSTDGNINSSGRPTDIATLYKNALSRCWRIDEVPN